MKAPLKKGSLLFATMTLAVAAVSACSSSSSGTQAAGAGNGNSSNQGPELTHVTVAGLEIPDAAPLYIAQKDGFFAQQGLTVTIDTIPASSNTTPLLLAHTLDFTTENYVGMYIQEAQNPQLGLKVIVDDLQAAPNVFGVIVPKDSKITSVSQLAGKSIGFPGLGTSIGTLAVDMLLRAYHVSDSDYKQAVVPFPLQPEALARNQVDAVFSTEPFITIEELAGSKVLADTMTGAMLDFPISCWATPGWFLAKYPRTVAAFQRALVKAQEVAATDPAAVRAILPSYIKGLKASIAAVMTLGTFNTTLSLTRLERVYNVMTELNLLPSTFTEQDAAAMLGPTPSGS
jgi:NitT/TauT family transport system substrate-binding protein